MKLDNDKEYYMKDLRRYLQSQQIPCSKPTLYKYEMEGVFKPRRKSIFGRTTRVFSADELIHIGELVKKRMGDNHAKTEETTS
jgi:hypothetical protein